MRATLFRQAIILVCLTISAVLTHAQTWTTLTNPPPAPVSFCLLLTDGGVMCQSGSAWYKLTPDSSGSYLRGTWSALASFPATYAPVDFASAVLADGRVVVVGGEYTNGNDFTLTNMGAIYDPAVNTWTLLSPPVSGSSPNHFQCIGDAPATVLADGRFIIGSKLYQDLAILNPATLTWSIVSATGKTDGMNAEEGWTLLPDGSFFTLDVKAAPASERFVLTGTATGIWTSSGVTPQDLHTPSTSPPLNAPGCPVYFPPGEVGPTLLRPDGTVFAIGADGFTGIYTPPTDSVSAGSWSLGPGLPAGLNVEDGPGAVLPSGHVLFGASPGASGTGLQYFEFDGTNLISVAAPANAGVDATYFTSLLLLPTGQVMIVDYSTTVQLYSAANSPTYNANWAPTISVVPPSISAGASYQITGTQFNGLNQGSAFGDEEQNATNYPLVRITNNATGHVFYAKTHGHSTMGVATSNTAVSTNFDVPAAIEGGPSTLQVVANGIPSFGASISVAAGSFYTISGQVTAGGAPLSGVAVNLTGSQAANVITDINGAYSFSGLAVGGNFAVAVSLHGYAFAVPIQAANGLAANLVFNFTGVRLAPAITQAFGGASVEENVSTTLTFTISNPVANPLPINGLAFTDVLPAGLAVATPNGLSGACGGTVTAAANSGTVTLAGGSLISGASCTIVVSITGTLVGVFANTVTIGSANFGTGNTSTVSLRVTGIPGPQNFQQLGVFRGTPGGLGMFGLDVNGNFAFDPGVDKFRFFGLSGDMPVAGDWFGTGVVALGVFRCPAAGVCQWYIDANNNGVWDGVAGGDVIWNFGLPGDLPIVGDWTGDGISKIGVMRCPPLGQPGICVWYLDSGNNHGITLAAVVTASYGLAGDLPVASNWTGTGNADQIGVFRCPATGFCTWFVDSNGDNLWEPADATYSYGLPGDIPMVGNWFGTGRKRIGVFRSGLIVLNVSGSTTFSGSDFVGSFGLPGDLPVIGFWTLP